MYHPRFRGDHYGMGYGYGKLMRKNNIHLKEVLALSREKMEFGRKCIAACGEAYPEAVEEMQGLADGWGLDFNKFAAWIFCIYCYEYRRGCTCLAMRDDDNIIFARNSDFYIEIRKVCESALYQPEKGYRFIGNSTAIVQMEDGCNECGLAVGLTFIPPKMIKPGLNAGMLLRYMLERCRTVEEALEALRRLPISSAQTLTMIDVTGDMAVAECNCEKTVVMRPGDNAGCMVATNQFITPEMKSYEILNFIDARERDRVARQALSREMRYSLKLARDILAGKFGFMCQYDRKSGFDTLWSTIYDIKNGGVFRAEGNPARAAFREDRRLSRAMAQSKR